MGEITYGKFIKAVNDFSAISNNITEICKERTASYYRTGTHVGDSLGGLVGAFLGNGKGSTGESVGSFFGSIIGGAIGEAMADSRNRSDIAEAKADIKHMLTEWKKTGLPIIEAYLDAYEKTSSLHDMEIEYFTKNSKLTSNDITVDDVKHCTYLLRQCIASQFREYYDVALGNNIISYFNNYSRHLGNLETFADWQYKFLYVDKTECFKTAFNNVVGKVEPALTGSSQNNFGFVLDYFASEVPAFLGTDYDKGIFEYAKNNALLFAESSISGKDTDYSHDYLCDGYGFQNIANTAINSFRQFESNVIKPKIRKMEIIAGIGLPIFMLLNLIIKIYRWFSISSPFFSFFLCRYWGNVLTYIILSQLVIFIAVLMKKKELASCPLDWKGFWNNFNSNLYYIRENAYETELKLPPPKIKTRKTSAKTSKDSQTATDVLSDDELMKLAQS